jgi:hypothetical protein
MAKGISISVISEFNPKGFIDAQKKAEGLTGEFGNLAKKAAAAFALSQVVDFVGKSVTAASNLEESANAVTTTYGDASIAIQSLAEDAVDSYGMSARQFNEFAVAFSGFASNIVDDGGNVAVVVGEMATRVADFASVHNLELSEAMSKFQSALAGETEAMRLYGIDLSAAAVEQYAIAEGLIEVGEEMTEAEKQTARYGLLLQKTEQWSGDFAATQESLANRQRTLSAEFENFQAVLGEDLAPVIADAMAGFTDFIKLLDTLGITDVVGDILNPRQLGTDMGVGLRRAFDDTADANYRALEAISETEIAFGEMDREVITSAESLSRVHSRVNDYADSLMVMEDGVMVDTIDRQHLLNLATAEYGTPAALAEEQTIKFGEALRDAATESTYAGDAMDELNIIQGDVFEATEKINTGVYTMIENMKELRGEISQREAFRNMYDDFLDASEVIDEFGFSSREGKAATDDLRLAVMDYADELNLPPEKTTEILALIDEGKLSEVQALLLRLEGGVTLPIKPEFRGRLSGTSISVTESGDLRIGVGALGGLVTQPTLAMIGEAGPEAVVPLSRMPGASPLPSGMGGGGGVNITVNAGVGDPTAIGRSVVDAIVAFERSNGKGWRAA